MPGGLCYVWRKIVNSDESRQVAVGEIFEKHPKVIIFYNFDYDWRFSETLGYGDGVESCRVERSQTRTDSKR